MLKPGKKIKAKWDGSTSEIIAIENGVVSYKCYNYDNQHLSNNNFNDGLFRDTEKDILEHFYFL